MNTLSYLLSLCFVFVFFVMFLFFFFFSSSFSFKLFRLFFLFFYSFLHFCVCLQVFCLFSIMYLFPSFSYTFVSSLLLFFFLLFYTCTFDNLLCSRLCHYFVSAFPKCFSVFSFLISLLLISQNYFNLPLCIFCLFVFSVCVSPGPNVIKKICSSYGEMSTAEKSS